MNTKQQEFDAVVNHLFAQGRPARKGDSGACAYRGENGTSCAVGCRIPDKSYSPNFEGAILSGLLKRAEERSITLPSEFDEYYGMFDTLQEIHDRWEERSEGAFSFDDLVNKLKRLADKEDIVFNDPRKTA